LFAIDLLGPEYLRYLFRGLELQKPSRNKILLPFCFISPPYLIFPSSSYYNLINRSYFFYGPYN
jgi:hypothetical protein